MNPLPLDLSKGNELLNHLLGKGTLPLHLLLPFLLLLLLVPPHRQLAQDLIPLPLLLALMLLPLPIY